MPDATIGTPRAERSATANAGRRAFGWLQKIGKSLMLPVSVLPAAGILLGVGSAKFTWLPVAVSDVMAQAGGAIFGNLPLIFAIGVALGLTGNDGVAALASVVGFAVMLATMGVMAPLLGAPTATIMGIPSIETGVFGGILIGAVAAILFNRYYRLQLPAYLGFFSGKRSVPILTAFAAIVFGIALSFVWPPIGYQIDIFSHWAAAGDPAVAFAIYGVVERALLPFGLHHIWNVPFFFQVGSYLDPATHKIIHGEIYRFTAGDPTAGNLAGGYLFKMWGLPAAALAIWRTAKPENRKRVGGLMISAALTSFLTGITEPIEFAFLFVAPVLYAIHALLAGAAYWVAIMLGIHHSTTFSHGLIDYVVLYPHSRRGWWLLWLGPLWALMYYAIFHTLIVKLDLKTPGREDESLLPPGEGTPADAATGAATGAATSMPARLVAAFGGADNIRSLDACITRLRVDLVDVDRASAAELRALGATGVMKVASGMQAVFGTRSENLKTDMEEYLRSTGGVVTAPATPVERAASSVTVTPALRARAAALVAALGGAANVECADAVALTRLRAEVSDDSMVDEHALAAAGAAGVWKMQHGIVHVIVGEDAAGIAAALHEGGVRALAGATAPASA
jgi:PTS system glucose-specific IIC component